MGRAEVGAVAAEDVDPLAAGVLDGLGDQVGDVALAAAGHPDVRRGGAGVLADQQVRGGDGLALGAVGGGGVGELDVLADVVRGQRAPARPRRRPSSAAVVCDAGDGPGVAVGDAEVAVVASGGDPVADADPLTRRGDDGSSEPRPCLMRTWCDAAVDLRDLLAGVGDDQLADARRVRRARVVRSTSLAWTTI